MIKENIRIYLLSNLSIIIGEDNGKEIKDAARVVIMSYIENGRQAKGPAITPLFMSMSTEKKLGVDVNKKQFNIVDSDIPLENIVEGYLQFLTGIRAEPSKIFMPKKQD